MQSGQRTTSSKLCQFLQTLDRLRANPEDDALWSEATAEGLKWIVAHLASDAAPLGPQSGYGHFYCQRGFHIGQPTDLQPVAAISVETMADIRSFLLRLISYKPKGFSAIWRDAFEACLQGCVDCAVGLGECMITLANKWLRLKSTDRAVSEFVASIHKALANMCAKHWASLPDVICLDVEEGQSASSPIVNLDVLRPALLALILSNPGILTIPHIWTPISQAIARYSSTTSLPIPCLNVSLPGLCLLSMSADEACASSARAQLAHFALGSANTNRSDSWFTPGMSDAIREVSCVLNRGVHKAWSAEPTLLAGPLAQHPTQNKSWCGMLSILETLPSRRDPHQEYGVTVALVSSTLIPLVASHLTDNGNHITTVLECFGILLRLMECPFWNYSKLQRSPSPELATSLLPHEALSQILTNSSFIDSLSYPGSPDRCAFWLIALINSSYSREESLATIFTQLHQILLVGLQDASIELQTRVNAMEISLLPWTRLVFRSLLAIGNKSPAIATCDLPSLPLSHHSSTYIPLSHVNSVSFIVRQRGVLQLFLPVYFDVAYRTQYSQFEWNSAQTIAQRLIEHIASEDVNIFVTAVQKLSHARLQLEDHPSHPISEEICSTQVALTGLVWTQLYQITKADLLPKRLAQVYSFLIRTISRCAHIDQLASTSWLPKAGTGRLLIKSASDHLNTACQLMRAPLPDMLVDLSETTSNLMDLLMDDKRVMQALVVLILSPHEAIHKSALVLVRQWSDCSVRLDCFRFLLSNGTNTAFEGLLMSLTTTELHTRILPDAMSLARRFVRCMTDVLEILCSHSDGLFSNPNFMNSTNEKQVVQLWGLMCSAVSNIFQRTPHWSQFWQTPEMTDWMRDALIFAEQLVHQFLAFERACTNMSKPDDVDLITPSDVSVRRQMVDSFMRPTEAILSWLRLTEPDLLDRSTSVLVTMLEKLVKFQRPLKPTIVDKLEKYLDRNKRTRLNDPQKKTGVVLTEQQCANIKKALASHPDLATRFAYESDESDDDSATILEGLIMNEDEQIANQKAAWGRVLAGNKQLTPTTSILSHPVASSSKSHTIDTKRHPNTGPLKIDFTSNISKHSSGKSYSRSTGSSSVISNMRKEFKASRQALNRNIRQPALPNERSLPPIDSRSTSLADSDIIQGLPSRYTKAHVEPDAPTRITMNVDDSDDSEEDVDLNVGLAALAKAQKPKLTKPRKLMEVRRTIKRFDDPTLEKHKQLVQARQQKQTQMKLEKLRMSPDFTALHRHILQWDYEHSGPCPPSSPGHFSHLPSSFDNFAHYLRSIEPLLMCECWQQICQAKEAVAAGEKTPVPCEVIGRTSVDDFVEVYTTIKHGMLPDRVFFTEADLVLMKAVDKPVSHCVMAKVISLSRKPESFELNLRLHFGSVRPEVSGFLVPKTKWEVLHLCSLSTTHREWAALRSLPYLTLADDILEARVAPPVQITNAQLTKVMQCQKVNEPQGRAIISSLATPGFSLIQGPPGTGKTSTIVGLIGAFIASRPAVLVDSNNAQSITRKILLCAPSNAAVDEVAKRLKDGVRGAQGELIIPKLVRIGADSKVNVAVKDIFIDELVEAQKNRLEAGTKGADGMSGVANRIHELRQQITEMREVRNAKQLEAEHVPAASPLFTTLQQEVAQARRKIHELSQQLDEARDQQAASKRYLDAATRKLRMQILQDADVVCSTLSGSGHDYMSQLPFDFETVVIDEACQCVEPASLIPLRYNATQCILVGDPLQLPPTVLSQTASRAGYDQSLFVRMHRLSPSAVHLLSIQYRMHPSISTFPSKAFYESRLMDGPDMATKTAQPWHSDDSLLTPYAFYHPIGAREERGRHHSFINRVEASLTVAIYSRLTRLYPDIDFAYRVGIITAYAGQVAEIRRQFRQAFHPDVVATVDINTVDGFQGQEKDVIILSCVRGGQDDNRSTGGIGFLKDTRRMNVALTRAKSSLFIIGNHSALGQDKNWKALVNEAQERGVLSEVSVDTFNSSPLSVRSALGKGLSAKTLGRHRVTIVKSEAPETGTLMTPQQIAQQSKARAQTVRDEASLKRKTFNSEQNLSASSEGSSKKPRVSDVNCEHSIEQRRLSLGHQERNSVVELAGVSRHEPHQDPASKKHLPLRTAPTRLPNASASSSLKAIPSVPPAKKGPVSLFITKKKRPTAIPVPREGPGVTDTRSVKQRLQDELKIMKKP